MGSKSATTDWTRRLSAQASATRAGGGMWTGDAREGVIVLPVEDLLPRYDPLPPLASV